MRQVIKAAEELFVDAPHFKLLSDSIPQIVWLADSNGSTYYYNARWYELIGREEGHDKEAYFYSHVLHPEDTFRARKLWYDCVREKCEFSIEYRFFDKKRDQYKWMLAKALPLKGADGDYTWYGTYTDIDEQKKSQEKLQESIQTRDEFISIASHELKTPITNLKLQLQMAMNKVKDEKVLGQSLKQTNRLSSLVDHLLDVTRLEAGNFSSSIREVDLSKLLKEFSQEMSAQPEFFKSPITFDCPQTLSIRLDPERVEQIFLNLYVNSMKYAVGSPVHIHLLDEANRIKIIFQDYGPGIEANKQQKIFERYERAHDSHQVSGLGLGLYIVKGIVEGHQGTIELKSAPGEGACFIITLPKLS
jgi:PAS domain S-box-containing protein